MDTFFGALLGGGLAARLVRRRERRLRERQQIELSLRLVTGDQPGLGRRWRHGRADATPGRLVFRRFVWSFRILRPRTPSVEIAVAAYRPSEWSLGLVERWNVTGSIAELVTGTGAVIECATTPAMRESLAELLDLG